MTEKPTPTNIPNSTSTAVSPRPVHTEPDQTPPAAKSHWWVWAIIVVVFLLIVAFMYRQYESAKAEHDKATFVLDLGSAAADVRVIDAELWADDNQLAVFHRSALAGHGYACDAIEPFDLMPGTAQIETVVRLRRG